MATTRAAARFLGRPLVLAAAALLLLTAGAVAWWYYPLQFLRAGEAALAARDDAEARRQLARYLGYRPADPHARLLAARAARRLREYFEAFEHLRLCRESGGDAEAVEVEASLIAVARGEEPSPALRGRAEADDELALVALEVLIQHDLDTYRLYSALHGLNRYLRRRPDDLHALLSRAFVWERFLYFADAAGDYRRAVEAHPGSERARLKLAQTLLIAGTPAEALEHYQWLAARHPERPEVKLGLARCHRLLGRPEEAARLLDDLTAGETHAEALWERGQLELDGGRPEQAEPWLRKATRANPHDRRLAYSLHRCLLALGRTEEAEQAAARVAALDADLRRLDEVRQAVMERPQDAALRREGGLLFLRNGERQEGIRWLQQAVRLDPGSREAREALAVAEKAIAPAP